jgi:hypothetical protein
VCCYRHFTTEKRGVNVLAFKRCILTCHLPIVVLNSCPCRLVHCGLTCTPASVNCVTLNSKLMVTFSAVSMHLRCKFTRRPVRPPTSNVNPSRAPSPRAHQTSTPCLCSAPGASLPSKCCHPYAAVTALISHEQLYTQIIRHRSRRPSATPSRPPSTHSSDPMHAAALPEASPPSRM